MISYASVQDLYADNLVNLSQNALAAQQPNALTSMLFNINKDAADFDKLMFVAGIKANGLTTMGLDQTNVATLLESAKTLGYEVEFA
jgi:hypothetical protein